jgi:hypothetical protein
MRPLNHGVGLLLQVDLHCNRFALWLPLACWMNSASPIHAVAAQWILNHFRTNSEAGSDRLITDRAFETHAKPNLLLQVSSIDVTRRMTQQISQ